MTPAEFLTAIRPLFPDRDSLTQVIVLAGAAGLLLTPAERLAPAAPQPLFWRKGLLIDMMYWFLTPLATRCVTGAVLAVILFAGAICVGFGRIPSDILVTGFGPLARQPLWLQCFEILMIADFVDYWTHRSLHRGPLWRIHAIHHSPEEMNWLSSSRVHPLNDLITRTGQLLPIVALGYSAEAVMSVVPFIAFYVMFLHANLRWDFGPLRWVLVSPAYHRWHHTSDDEGIDKNFSGIFPIWDVIFGTAYFPRALPKHYGLVGYRLPDSLVAHMLFPFGGSARPSTDLRGHPTEPRACASTFGGDHLQRHDSDRHLDQPQHLRGI